MLVSRCSCAVPVKLRVRRIVGYRWSLWFRRFWTKGSGSVTLRAASPRESTLPGKLLNADFFVLRARQGCHERDQIVDFILGQLNLCLLFSLSVEGVEMGFAEKDQISRRKPSSTLHRQFAWSLFASRRLIFFGCSMEDPYIKALLDAVATDLWEWNLRIHFVVLPIDEGAVASVDNRVAEFKRYGVEVVFFDNWDGTYAGKDSMLDEAKLLAWVGDGATASRSEQTDVANEHDAPVVKSRCLASTSRPSFIQLPSRR